jgi:hypothetical protein
MMDRSVQDHVVSRRPKVLHFCPRVHNHYALFAQPDLENIGPQLATPFREERRVIFLETAA